MYAINKILFDYIQVNIDFTLEGDVLQALSELLLQKPQYDWSLVKWHEGTPLPDNVINKKEQGVITELEVVMDYIVSNTEKEAFQDENAFQKAQNNFIHAIHRKMAHLQIHVSNARITSNADTSNNTHI